MPDLTRFFDFFTQGVAIDFNLLIFEGQNKLDAALAEGDAKAAQVPELAPEWTKAREKLVAEWAKERAALEASRDDPEMRATLQNAINEAWNTVVKRHGELGPSHGLSG